MTEPSWIHGTYDDALQLVAERALFVRSQPVKSAVDWQEMLADPRVQAGIAGAGIGGLGGALLGKHKGRDAMLGALAGGGLGAGIAHLGRDGDPVPDTDRAATGKAQSARQSLGVLGADEKKINSAVGRQQKGEQSERRTVRDIKHSVPGSLTQLRNVPASFGTALEEGRLDDAADQADVFGLKGVVPASSHFSPGTAALGVGANVGARHLSENYRPLVDRRLQRGIADGSLLSSDKTKQILGNDVNKKLMADLTAHPELFAAIGEGERNTLQAAHRAANPASTFRKATGGVGPLLAGLSPLLLHEWFGNRGYRSGDQPAHDLAGAVSTLSGKHKQ